MVSTTKVSDARRTGGNENGLGERDGLRPAMPNSVPSLAAMQTKGTVGVEKEEVCFAFVQSSSAQRPQASRSCRKGREREKALKRQ